MGRFTPIIGSPTGMEGFRVKYHIPHGVALQLCALNQVLTHRNKGEVVIPMITFI